MGACVKYIIPEIWIRWNEESDEPFLEASASFVDACLGLTYRDHVLLGHYKLVGIENITIQAHAVAAPKRGVK